MNQTAEIGAVILAGGKASRMGYQDKALLTLHKKPLIEYVIAKACDQVGSMVISVNHNLHLYNYLQLPLIPDYSNQYAGPLVGIYSAMRHFNETRQQPDIKYLACLAADVPHFPSEVISALYEELTNTQSQVACCVCDGQIQPLFSLWSLETIDSIALAINRGIFGPKLLFPELRSVTVEIPFTDPGYFLNINSEESLNRAKVLIRAN